jgi:hypothetical protein
MIKPTFRKKRSKLAMILLIPIFPIVFLAGWSLYCIGESWHQNNTNLLQKPTNNTSTKQEETELVMTPQEEQIIAN